jgi:hypothetical protein
MSGMTFDVKKRLSEALIKLSYEKPLEKITILDLTEQAGMGRQTFYYHFEDKYDLIKWTTMTLARQGWDEYFDERGVYLTLLNTDIYIYKYRRFFAQAWKRDGKNPLPQYMIDYNIQWYIDYLSKHFGASVLTDELLFAIKYHAYGAGLHNCNWVAEKAPQPPAAKAQFTINCIPGILKQYLPIK